MATVMALYFSALQFLSIFLALPNLVLNDPVCSAPYECMSASRCAQKLPEKATERVLFRCLDKSEICCPPVKAVNKHSQETLTTKTIGNFPYNFSGNRQPETHTDTATVNCSFCNYQNGQEVPLPTGWPTKGMESPTSRFASHRNFRLLPSTCGLNDFPNRITEGEEADLGEFPWMALVGVRDRLGDNKWFCGGTLISPRYVLTAAHCVYDEEDSIHVVRLGEHNLENHTDCDITNFCLNPPVDIIVEEVIVHNQWNSTTIKNDIALYRLSQEAPESFSVSPICLPIDMKPRNTSEDIKYGVAGWGKTDWNAQPGSSVLRKGTLSSVTNEDCNLCKAKLKERYCPITRKQMCAQGWKSVDVCKGDSGGPLMSSLQRVYQVGITSFKASEYCGADNIPSVFTRVESYVEWILDNMRE